MQSLNPELGKYLVIEGSDGSGKGTQCDLAQSYLEEKGFVVVRTFEPGGTTIGAKIREVLKYEKTKRHPKTDVDLLTASRRESADQVIRPAVAIGSVALVDRSYFSTIAYQGFGDGVDIGYILERSLDALQELVTPDLAVVLRVPYELLAERLCQRGGTGRDYFESKGPDYFKRVAEGYDWICENLPVKSVDGTGTPEEVWKELKEIIKTMEVSHGV